MKNTNCLMIAAFSVTLLLSEGCASHKTAPTDQPPDFGISTFKVEKAAGGGGNIRVEGTGATVNSRVVVSLDYAAGGDDTESELGSVNADSQGNFGLTVFQKCVFPAGTSPVRAFIKVRDAATGRGTDTAPLDPSFLICPK